MDKLKKILFTLVFVSFLSSPLFAQTGGGGGDFETIIKAVIAIFAALTALVLWLVFAVAEKEELEDENAVSPLQGFWNLINKRTPIEDENKILLEHDFDGIRELDNKIPPWFNAILWGTVVFAIVYMVNYHIIGSGNVQEEEYAEEMRAAKMQRELLSESGALVSAETVTALTDPADLERGKKIFLKNCAACHGQNGEGLVGPNFTDEYWIHGGGIKNVFHTISEGVPAKGMISWKSQLSPGEIQTVGSYVLSLRGTSPPNQKGPEGKKWDSSEEDVGGGSSMADKGIGPIKNVEIGAIDLQLAKTGEEVFVAKCSACHKIEKRFVGPALKDVTKKQSPEWIMNMILNPAQMIKENATAKKLLAEYLTQMANQNLTQDEARSVLEYLRTQTSDKK
ncbi:MAG: c-type cytochrome [Chlorobi bacterium]|nr:c-type cytochrome [Chlorobiota bacterium]